MEKKDGPVSPPLTPNGCDIPPGEVASFAGGGVMMQNGSYLRADVVIMCTGYQKTYDYLPGVLKSDLQLQRDGLYLVSVTVWVQH